MDIVIIVAAVVMCIGLIALVAGKFWQMLHHIQIQEKQIEQLKQGIPLDEQCLTEAEQLEIKRLKDQGRTVEAIKRVRELTALDLVEAKRYVDLL